MQSCPCVKFAPGYASLEDTWRRSSTNNIIDPLFWLLHANVDRLTCIWQTLWPDEYVESANSTQGSYYFPNGNMDNIDTGLFPFHRTTSGKFWTARSARNISSFAYTYPEFDGLGGNRMAARNLLRSRIESKYTLTDQPSA